MAMDRAAVSYLYELSAAAGGGVTNGGVGPGGAAVGGLDSIPISVNSQLPNEHLIAPGDENYCLRWNEFEKKYAESFRLLRDNEYFTDVTITTDGHSVKAHRVILSACSTYFHAILKSMSPWQHPVLMLSDVKPHDLNALMDFIYFGQVHISQASLETFLKIAQRLKIKGLCETLSPVNMPPPPPQMNSRVVDKGVAVNQGVSLPPMANSPHSAGGGNLVVANQNAAGNAAAAAMGNMSNFENLLPRSPYVPSEGVASQTSSAVQLPQSIPRASAPPAHQSPKQMRATSTPGRPAPEPLMYVSPKRTKYSAGTVGVAGGVGVAAAAGGAPVVPAPPLSPQSILRNQLQLAKEMQQPGAGGGAGGGATPGVQPGSEHHVEVKSEPMAILSTQEDMPSSGVNVQELMSSHEGDLATLSASMPHGISPQFMFSPDTDANNSGAGGAGGNPGQAGQTLVAVEDRSGGGTAVRMVDASSLAASTGVVTPGGVVTSVNVSGHSGILVPTSHHLHSHLPTHSQHQPQQQAQQQQQQQQSQLQQQHPQHDQSQQQQQPLPQQHHQLQLQNPMHAAEEPQDLTPAHDSPAVTPASTNSGGMHTPSNHTPVGGNLGASPSTPTPPKNNGPASAGGTPTSGSGSEKKCGARKSCPYCHKDFHEMSLKRHIKDVHFRNQNTYVICPQCCKQYASQNSLYSHLNRVHNVKKDVMSDIQLQMVANNGAGGNSSSSGTGSGASGSTPNESNHHEGSIVNLAQTQHSDSSNG